jgi:hypothetical protein
VFVFVRVCGRLSTFFFFQFPGFDRNDIPLQRTLGGSIGVPTQMQVALRSPTTTGKYGFIASPFSTRVSQHHKLGQINVFPRVFLTRSGRGTKSCYQDPAIQIAHSLCEFTALDSNGPSFKK